MSLNRLKLFYFHKNRLIFVTCTFITKNRCTDGRYNQLWAYHFYFNALQLDAQNRNTLYRRGGILYNGPKSSAIKTIHNYILRNHVFNQI